MREDVEDVPRTRVYHRKSVNFVVDQDVDGLEQRGVGIDPYQVLHVWQSICGSTKRARIKDRKARTKK